MMMMMMSDVAAEFVLS